MQCEEFEARLNEALDRRLPLSAAEALAHQRVCSPCRERAAAYAAIARELAQAPLPIGSEDLAERVLAELRQPGAVPFVRRRRSRALAAAAVLLVSLFGAWALHRVGEGPVPRQVAGNAHRAGAEHLSSPPKPAKRAPARELVSTAPAHAKSSSKNVEDAPALSDAALPAAEWAQQVADGFQPVTRPTLGAATGFLQVWGVTHKRPPPDQRPRS
ncbi:MAG TPA: hypothetical protein VFW87_11305 [Pirellulales bacterium]|nr:hypothetical protein [Pirellulales bacterium]